MRVLEPEQLRMPLKAAVKGDETDHVASGDRPRHDC